MQKLAQRIGAFFDTFIKVLAVFGIVSIVFMTLAIGYDVTTRYILRQSVGWVLEVSEYLLVYLTFLGTAWVLKNEGHTTIDILVDHLQPKKQAILNVITSCIGAVICFILTWYGTATTVDLYQRGLIVIEILAIPKFLTTLVIPIGCGLLFIQFIRRIIKFCNIYKLELKK
jgi:C4-dicarboxylate transporter, DctQ subunit